MCETNVMTGSSIRITMATTRQSDVDETLKRLAGRKGVEGVVILNSDGLAIRSTIEAELTKKYASHVHQLVSHSKDAISGIDSENELTFLRVRTKKHELMIAPDKEYLMIVVQNFHEN